MTSDEVFAVLKRRFSEIVRELGAGDEEINVKCRALTPDEAIGQTKRRDFPIITGKDVMIQAEFRGVCGQAFTDAPMLYSGSLSEILELDIINNPHNRGLFVASLNAVMRSLNRCIGTVHCRTDGPELCAKDMLAFLRENYPNVRRIGLVGYQPALLENIAGAGYELRVLDLNPANIGAERYGVLVESGSEAKDSLISWAELILCTGSTLCNGTITDYIIDSPEVLFFGITLAGAAPLLGLKRVCFADRYGSDMAPASK
ncbi:MAG: hypothetical protein HUJ65_06745 [Oscillospiraceae bacterium]|nr:hypothetical protein [Oscillospiraceae bacterium]